MVVFDKNLNLGGAVSSWTTFSEIGNKPIADKKQLTIAGGRHKMSRLCGFVFTAKDGSQFSMAFVCKLRSKINHQQKKQVRNQWTIPSRWFFLTRTGNNQLNVFSKQKALEELNFNVDAFFDSDVFNTEVPKLQKTVKSGLSQARKFAESLSDEEEKRLAIEEVSAIELSIPLMKEDRFEDKNYPLINYEIKEQENMKNESSFDQYDWKDGSLTGKGLIKMIQDSGTGKQNTLNAAVKIYDRSSNKYFNIVDSHLGKNNTGIMLEIDINKSVNENQKNNDVEARWKELRKRWELPKVDGNIIEEINAIIPDFQKKISSAFGGCIKDYQIENAMAYVIDNEGNENLWDKSDTIESFLKNIIEVAADRRAEFKESHQIEEADDREPTSHALDVVGVKHSTATTAGQDVAEISIIDDIIDADIEEAMKEIYK